MSGAEFKLKEIVFTAMSTEVAAGMIMDDSEKEAGRILDAVRHIFLENEKRFSRFDAASELSRLNKNLNEEVSVSEKMARVLNSCLAMHKLSRGYFDPRIIADLEAAGYRKNFQSNDFEANEEQVAPEIISEPLERDLILDFKNKKVRLKKRVDLSGIAKGFSVDEAARYLKDEKAELFFIDAGGDMYFSGLSEEGDEWRIGVEGIADEKIKLRVSNEGVATSGISRRRWTRGGQKFHHLLNPQKPGEFSFELKSVTVMAEKTETADALAKSIFLMGRQSGMEFTNANGIKALILDYRGNVYVSQKIKENLIAQE